MKNILIAFAMMPFAAVAQNPAGYSIKGTITGYPDGTKVSFLDRSNNSLDSVAVINNNTFFIEGEHLQEPDFRFLVFNDKQPVIPVLLDNSKVTINGSKDQLDSLSIEGSPVYTDYKKLSNKLAPYNSIFQNQNYTPENVQLIAGACEEFVREHPASYVSLLAVSQVFQLSHDAVLADEMLGKVDKSQKNTVLAKYLAQQIDIEKSTSIGAHILPFTQNDVSGKPVSISDFKGKYVLIDFWASWCRPCRMENPNVVSNFNRFKDKNFTVLGVSLDQSKESWETAIKMDNLAWTQVSDLKGWQNEVSSMFHITSIPTNILIDPNGIIVGKNIRGGDLGKTLEKLLK